MRGAAWALWAETAARVAMEPVRMLRRKAAMEERNFFMALAGAILKRVSVTCGRRVMAASALRAEGFCPGRNERKFVVRNRRDFVGGVECHGCVKSLGQPH